MSWKIYFAGIFMLVLSEYFVIMFLQQFEYDQLLSAVQKGDTTAMERLVNIRYLDVNALFRHFKVSSYLKCVSVHVCMCVGFNNAVLWCG